MGSLLHILKRRALRRQGHHRDRPGRSRAYFSLIEKLIKKQAAEADVELRLVYLKPGCPALTQSLPLAINQDPTAKDRFLEECVLPLPPFLRQDADSEHCALHYAAHVLLLAGYWTSTSSRRSRPLRLLPSPPHQAPRERRQRQDRRAAARPTRCEIDCTTAFPSPVLSVSRVPGMSAPARSDPARRVPAALPAGPSRNARCR